MKTITYYKSSSGSTTLNHIIYNENEVSVKSLASLILLNNFFYEMDEDFLNDHIELQDYLNKRHLFLISEIRSKGVLICHYCGKSHLEIGYRHFKYSKLNNNNKMLATIDHIIPKSSGINPNDISNWVVSCKKCNTKKGSMSYEKFKNEKI